VSVKRRVVENLRPSLLDNLGLAPALEWYISEHCSKGGLKCTLNLAEELGTISPDASIALFRIVQEGTTNALRHAKAKHFSASLHIEGKNIHLVLEDDGLGLPDTFNPAKMSHGLSGIRQRARSLGGDAIWKSAPGKGTTVTVIIPRNVDENDVDAMSATIA
jgi:signal transduction histidine kinase